MWFEELPSECPPKDSTPPNGVFFRLVNGVELSSDDFMSLRYKWPEKVFKADECIARAVSVFGDISDCLDIKKLPAHKNKNVAQIRLSSSDGSVKRTGKAESHHSWWRSDSFEALGSFEVIES